MCLIVRSVEVHCWKRAFSDPPVPPGHRYWLLYPPQQKPTSGMHFLDGVDHYTKISPALCYTSDSVENLRLDILITYILENVCFEVLITYTSDNVLFARCLPLD